MKKVNIRETREQISRLLNEVAAGEEIVVTRRGQAAARIVRAEDDGVRFPDRAILRAALPPMVESASDCLRKLREEERY